MKLTHNISKIGFLATVFGLLALVSCKEDFPEALDSTAKMTELKSIKIVNAGENGDIVLEGVVDENKKTISFPRIVPETDFSNLKFEAELSDGARLENETFNVVFEEGQAQKVITIKAVNDPRYREYLAVLRLKIPVFGADFSKPQVHDYSTNPQGNPMHDGFGGQLTRGTGFDGEHVLVVQRANPVITPHLLSVSDLRNNTIARIPLNITGVTGGTYPINMGAQVNGHTYMASLSTTVNDPLKIYHWLDPSAPPTVIADLRAANIPGAGARHGDNMSFNLDGNGNGFVYFISNGPQILRLKIANYTEVSEPFVITPPNSYLQWSSFLQVGNTDSYLLTSNTRPISIANSSGSISYTMAASSIPANGTDARIITFNEERYLMMVTVPRYVGETATLYVYNITQGDSVQDALTIFEQGSKIPLYQYTITSSLNTAPATQSGYAIEKDQDGNDEKLLLYAATTDAGFAIIEFPIKRADD